MKRTLFSLLAFGAFSGASSASAAVSDADIALLREQIAALSIRLEELAAENAELRRSQAQSASAIENVRTSVTAVRESGPGKPAESWTDRIRLDGDFRYRFEHIDAEGSPGRDRNRIRARTNIKARLADDIEVGFGLATGSDDPVSSNQTLGGGGSSKNIVLNLAYMDWAAADGLQIVAGKYKNPLRRVGGQPLMWDGDWTPEGFAVNYERDWFFLNTMGTFLESDTRKSNDNFSWGAQVGATGEIGGAKVTGGLGYYSIQTKGESTTFGDPGDPGDYFGNSAVEESGLACGSTPDTDCAYLYDYLLTQVFGEAAFELGDWSTTLFFDYVNNSDPADNDTAWSVGTRIAAPAGRSPLRFTYYYAEKEADALLGLLTDSDFGGGGTDNKGHWVQLSYKVNSNWTIGAQYFINENDILGGSKRDYNRLMLDTQWAWK